MLFPFSAIAAARSSSHHGQVDHGGRADDVDVAVDGSGVEVGDEALDGGHVAVALPVPSHDELARAARLCSHAHGAAAAAAGGAHGGL